MSRYLLKAAVLAAFLSAAGTAQAAITVFQATLSGLNEVPANASPGSGFAQVTIDDVLRTMSISANFSGLTGTTTSAHIHCCTPAGTNIGVATTTPTFPGFPLGVSSGTYANVFDLNLASTYSNGFLVANGGTAAGAYAALLTGLNDGNAYFNVHSTSFPGGEIRGQLSAVPEPGTWAMMIVGFGLAGATLRRRRPALA